MGTPQFACSALARLYADGYDLCGVFTQPDKARDRGQRLAESPVKKLARQMRTPVYQPASLRDGQATEVIRGLAPELIVVAAYGKLLPKEILTLPRLGCVNIHGSLLPKYRGAAPVQWAVLNGEPETGVTLMHMAEAMDAGDIIAARKTSIGETETAGALMERLAEIGAALLSETLPRIADKTAGRTPQDEQAATYAPSLSKDMAVIDWTKNGTEILNQIRGLNPWPMAIAQIGDKRFKVFEAVKTARIEKACGEVVSAGENGLEIACGDGTVVILELQAPGKKRMKAADYLRGNPLRQEK